MMWVWLSLAAIALLFVAMRLTDSVVTIASYLACIILIGFFVFQLAMARTPRWRKK